MLLVQLSVAFSYFLQYPQANWALVVLIPRWVVLCTFQGPMGLSKELSCEAGSLSHHLNHHRFFHSEVLRIQFSALEPWVVQSVSISSYSSWFICMQIWDCPLCQLPPCHESSLPWLPISPPPTGLDECFFFNSLVVGLSYSSIFCQFCLFIVFKFVVVLLLVVQGGTVYLPMPPSWPEVCNKKCFDNIAYGASF